MASYALTIICGNCTNDPQVKFLANETAVANFTVAVNDRYKNRNGETMEDVTYYDCVAWKRTAELIGQYVTKGKPLLIEAKGKTEKWEDQNTGQKRSKMVFVVQKVQFLGERQSNNGHSGTPEPKPTRMQSSSDNDEGCPF